MRQTKIKRGNIFVARIHDNNINLMKKKENERKGKIERKIIDRESA